MRRMLSAVSIVALVMGCSTAIDPTRITAQVETDPVYSEGDAADDAAIWVHPGDADLSVVIGTDKRRGLEVYDLQGKRLAELSTAALNNVDLRQDVDTPNGRKMDLIVASDVTNNTVVLFSIEPETRRVYELPLRADMVDGASIYGICLGRTNDTLSIFAVAREGKVAQYRFDFSGLQVERQFSVPSKAEGCVVDDISGAVFVAEEDGGIWRFAVNDSEGELIAKVDGNHLAADIEGLTFAGDLLLASSQGNSRFAVLERTDPYRVLGSFVIEDGKIDGAQETDGIAASIFPSKTFPRGMLVVQDGYNGDSGEHQNFKYVDLRPILDRYAR